MARNPGKIFLSVMLFIAGVLILVWPMLYNGYPLVYSDTGTYLRNSIKLTQATDRPIGYGIFLRICSMQAITWNAVFGQAIIVWLVTFRIVKLHFLNYSLIHFIFICVLAVGSSLPWYASQLMPDIFSGIIVLLVWLLFFDSQSTQRFFTYAVLLAFLTMTHYSYFLLSGASIILIGLFHFRKKIILFKMAGALAFLAVSVLMIMWFNYSEYHRFKFSMSSNLFLTAKFTDGNILNTYLRDNCGKKDIPFCTVKDSAMSPMMFLWSSEMPFQKELHMNWEKANDKCAVIVHDVFTTPKYQQLFIKEAFRATLQQLTENRVGSGLISYKSPDSPPATVIAEDFESELPQFMRSRQNNEDMENNRISDYIDLIVLISALITFAGLIIRPVRQKAGYLLLLCLTGVFFNAAITASLANVYDRLQARITWIVEFSALIVIVLLIVQYLDKRKAKLN